MKNFVSSLLALLIYLAIAIVAFKYFLPEKYHTVECYRFNTVYNRDVKGLNTRLDIPENGSRTFWACDK